MLLTRFALLAALLLTAAGARADGDPPVTVVRVAKGDVPEYAAGIGTVQAYRSVLVRARVDGQLDSIAFQEGQTIHPGDVIAQIDPRPYAATLAQAQAKRSSDQAQIDNARRDLARYAALERTAVASRQQYDTQQAMVAQLTANLTGDEAAVASAALNLSFCRITAPIEGVVGLRLVDIGNQIHASDQGGIVSIQQVQPISLVFTLPQERLAEVRAAMVADKTAPVAAMGRDASVVLAEGRLVTINNAIDTQTGTITLKAEFANHDDSLWPGQFVTGRLRLRVARGALTVPPSSVQHGPDGLYVYTVDANRTVGRTNIKIGYQDDQAAIVTDGLHEGDAVVLSGQLLLQTGMRVDPRPAQGHSQTDGGQTG